MLLLFIGGNKMILLVEWLRFWNRQVKKFGILEVKLAQLCAMCFGLVFVKLFPQITELNVWWFVLFGALCAIRPLFVVLRSPSPEARSIR